MHGSSLRMQLFLVTFFLGGCQLLLADEQDGTGGPDSEIERTSDGFVNESNGSATAVENERSSVFSISDDEDPFHMSSWLQPIQPPPTVGFDSFPLYGGAADVPQVVFSTEGVRRSLIAQYRPTHAPDAGNEIVFGTEGLFRVTTDGGNLLKKSLFAPAIKVQQRTPVVTDPRIRGSRYGGLLASGSYWAPARQDLDTVLSKIDSRIIRDVVIVKGPYSARYGPGFYFIDFQFLDTPRYANGARCFSSTSLEYKTNGEQWYGRQSIWGGGANYGYRVSYGHRTGNDYNTGSSAFDAGGTLPSSYNSRHLDVAFGYDLSTNSHLEFNYLRLDQTGVEFPGLVYDINTLYTDGFELRYTLEGQSRFDLLEIEGWYNRTPFHGDTNGAGKNQQIPTVNSEQGLTWPGEYMLTDVDGMSAGFRAAVTWGQPGDEQLTIGADLIRIGTQLNDIVPQHDEVFPPPPAPPIITTTIPTQNFPIPRSHSIDVGIFAEHTQPHGDRLTVHTGARVDLIATDARDFVPNLRDRFLNQTTLSNLKQTDLDQQFNPWSVFATADYEVNTSWTLTGGAGFGMRPPTLTELYAAGPFIGSLQPGLSYVEGDPELEEEKLFQLDLGIRSDLGRTRMSLTGFHAWVDDYITYDDIGNLNNPSPPFAPYVPGVTYQHVAYVNTDLATLAGFEFTGEHDFCDWLTGFALMSYVEGRDHTRSDPSRIGAIFRDQNPLLSASDPRSLDGTAEKEPLPGIPPLEARLGLHLHQPSPNPVWGIELEARIVDRQDRVAQTLYEVETPGFTVWNARGYWQAFENFTMFAGVENFTDRFYQEHLDYRSGRGVYRPGINFYFLTEFIY